MVQELIRRRADVNARNNQKLVPLGLSIIKARVAAAATLLAHGADLTAISRPMLRTLTHELQFTDSTPKDKKTILTLLGNPSLVGLYRLSAVDPSSLKAAWFQPLSLSRDILVSSLCFQLQLVLLQLGGVVDVLQVR